MTQQIKEQLEEVIKKNLPEPAKGIEKVIENTEQDRIYNLLNENMVIGFNQALSQIDTSLMADEVLKVVVEKIREKIEDLPTLYNSIEHLIAKDDILDLLDNLSPNK